MLLAWWRGEAIVTVRPAGRRSPARWSTEDSPGSTLDQLVADVADDRRSDRVVDAKLGQCAAQTDPRERGHPDTGTYGRASRMRRRRHRYPHVGVLADLAWTWRDNLTFYDALYVALAVRLDVPPLLTGDRRLGRAPVPCSVELV